MHDSEDRQASMTDDAFTAKRLTEAFVERINVLIRDAVSEGGTVMSVAGMLIGAGVELAIRSGAPDKDIYSKCIEILDAILPQIRAEISRHSS